MQPVTPPSPRKIALIGQNIRHSKSPAMMNRAFRAAGLNYHYGLLDIAPHQLKETLDMALAQDYAGLTITMPYKIEVLQYLHHLDPMARLIGSVNTVSIHDGKLTGYNTDGEGFVQGIEQNHGIHVPEHTFFIIGAGGAARAIATVLASRKPKRIYLESRTYETAAQLCRHINDHVYSCCIPLESTANFAPYLQESTVLINTSPVGMAPQVEHFSIDPALLHPKLLVVDIIYNPLETKLLQAARALGCRAENGQFMLKGQGMLAFRLWTGHPAPEQVMHDAVYGV